ncbi:mitogen-activated protein kinase [Plakobranchus ocellatus]|uniref:Mitogen-activated protein kinase n=1 Tax=Plakobranchus ocellatus TaxID=259542 RepID=A0AAV4DAF1_9GAST|nr:mitogen-activated protein kinase [Plakobranchus ocellatus]
MSVNPENKKASDCLSTSKPSKTMDLEQIRQTMAKRSLDVKFDLHDSGYEPVENIGIGAYGVVCSAIHSKSGDRVAIKKIPCVFDALTIAKRTYREIKILKHFKHDNIICIREILKPNESVKDFKDVYVVFDLMESDLHRIIYSKQDLSEEHVRYFLYQILRGLKYIHSANVIHRDLKPSNLLVNEDCHLRIGDFGMARGISYTPHEPSYFMTQYVATRWYRAPEILLSMLEYGTAVDMWSVGCIFAEMLGRKHLFPGKDYLTQVKLILGVLGTPSEKVMSNCQNDILKRIIKSLGKKSAVEWSKLFPKASKKSIDLLSKMLVLDPAERISPERSLSHRLLNNYHDPDDEPVCVPAFNFDFEKQDMDKKHLRSAIMEEVMSFYEPKPAPPTLSFNAFLRPVPKDDLSAASVEVQLSRDVISHHSGTNDDGSATSLSLSKPLPASLNTNILAVAAPADVEMLSAQSTMDMQESLTEIAEESGETIKVIGEDCSQQQGDGKSNVGAKVIDKKMGATGNTISEDTKALVKQALMNANHRRQRAESQGEDNKDSKPVTAMQRQREREEKRRKKKERALEKVKKNKNKKGAQQEQSRLLSTQDMELLRRWTSMQKPGATSISGQESGSNSNSSPPHPGPSKSPMNNLTSTSNDSSGNSQSVDNKGGIIRSSSSSNSRQILAKTASCTALPVTLGNSLRFSTAENSSGATVLISSSQLNTLGQTNFIPVFAIPSATTPGKVEIKRILPQQPQQQKRPIKPSTLSMSNSQDPIIPSTSSNQHASESTRSLLQNVLRERTQGGGQLHNLASGVSTRVIPTENSSKPTDSVMSMPLRNTSEQLKLGQTTNNSANLESQSVPALSSHFPTDGKISSSFQSDQDFNIPMSREEDALSPLGSAGSDLMEFLDQLKDSSTHLKLESAGSGLPLQSPTLPSFDQIPSVLPIHLPGGDHGGLTICGNSEITNNCSFTVLKDCDPNSQETAGPHHQQQQRSRPVRSSLPFPSFTDCNGDSQQQPSLRPSRSSVPVISYLNNHVETSQKQSIDPLLFTNFSDNNVNTSQQVTATSSRSSFPSANYSDNFVLDSNQQKITSACNQEFTAVQKLQQQPMQVNYNRQASDILFPSSSGFSSEPSHLYQQNLKQTPHLHQFSHMHQQKQNENAMVNFFKDPTSYPSFSVESPSTVNKNVILNQNSSSISTPHQQPRFSAASQSFHQPGSVLSQVHPSSYGSPQHQQNSDINSAPSSSVPGSRSPGLTVDCGKSVSNASVNISATTTTTITISNLTSDSSTASQAQQRQSDLIALLSKQLSRAEVADIFPPALALTPRGTGAGYGVGMDLDLLLTDAQDGASLRAESSPLSSSLLADWLDLSSSISQADIEALEREMALQSPMHVSYGDLNM